MAVVKVAELPASVPYGCKIAPVAQGFETAGAGDELVARLDGDGCCNRYARIAWEPVAALLVEAIQTVGEDFAELRDWIQIQNAPEQVRTEATRLIYEGMNWAPGTNSVSDGEHRLCAMRAQGVIEVGVFLCE